MAQRRGILGLSDAVLGMICSQFCPHCVGEDCLGGFELPGSFGGPAYFGTLVALTQVNVRIGRLAQAARLHLFCARRDSLPLLVRSLVENPALAAHIRVVRLGDCDRDSNHGCILRDLASPQIIEGLKTLVAAELGADIDLSSAEGEQRLLAAFEQLPQPEDCSPVALEHIAGARLSAFLLFKLAKNIKSIAILSEWPLAVFPELKRGPRIKVKQAEPSLANAVSPGLLLGVEELRLDSHNENHQPGSRKCQVDIRKIAGILSHLPRLRSLEIRGGHDLFSVMQLLVCRPALENITTLTLTATSESALIDIVSCCNPAKLKHFRFTIPAGEDGTLRHGNDIQGRNIVGLLMEYNLAANLSTLHIDTSESTLYGADPADLRRTFITARTLSEFTSLEKLTISADTIYYPSMYPRILLRDSNTATVGQRLIGFLPPNLSTLEITGIYAIHSDDVADLAVACQQPDRKFANLQQVTLRGYDGAATRPIGSAPYPVPGYEEDGEDDWFNGDWHGVEHQAESFGASLDAEVWNDFRAAGVEYEFDMPEFYFDRYAAASNQDYPELADQGYPEA